MTVVVSALTLLILATGLLAPVPLGAMQQALPVGVRDAAGGTKPFPIVGFNINLYGRNRLNRAPNLPNALDQLVATGSNTALVTTPYFQTTNTSTEIFADPAITETDDDLVVLFTAL